MKKLTTLLFIALITKSVFSQDIEKCKEIVEITTEAINKKSVTDVGKYLASDFEIAGQKGEIAKLVLNQLFSQLGEKVLKYKEINHQTNDEILTLVYSITYEKMGVKNATFVFNDQNLLTKMELFKMEVKTMDNSESKINLPQENIITIPFVQVGNLIAVEVILNNEKRIFLLDSGSPKVILNSHYLTKSDKENSTKRISSSKGVGGNISGMDIEKIEKLDFAGIVLKNQEVLSMDISHLEKAIETNLEIYGLIGYDLLKDYDLLFDYKNSNVTLIKPDYYKEYERENLMNNKLEIITFNLSSHIPIIKAKIGDNIYSFGIDCGAESNLIDSKLLENFSHQLKKAETDTLLGADNKKQEVTKGLIKRMTIGSKHFKNTPTVFSDISHLNNSYKIKIDGLIGYVLLSKQKTLISYKRKQMIFIE